MGSAENYPDGKRFAFSIFDDTDYSTLENVEPVYRFLADLGILTTKSVWPLPSVKEGRIGGDSLARASYLEFVERLQNEGFEIALHGVRNHHSHRDIVIEGLRRFRESLGTGPRTHVNHLHNRDNVYWGSDRLTLRVPSLIYNLATRFRRSKKFRGHVPGSPYFWGDLCREKIDYVRNLVFEETDILQVNPTLPYHNPAMPFVRFWFSSTVGDKVPSFCRNLAEERQDRLEEAGGVCIMYTHFGMGFHRDGALDPRFRQLMTRLSKKKGWFVPVATLLDFLRTRRERHEITRKELSRMERRWLTERLRSGTT